MADATLLALAGLDAARSRRARHLDPARPRRCCPPWRKARSASPRAATTTRTRALLAKLNDAHSATGVACERAFLASLDGSCKTPIAGLAEIDDGVLRFRGLVLSPTAAEWHEHRADGRGGACARASAPTRAEELLARAGPNSSAQARLMRVLVTRPEPDATRQAEALAARGHERCRRAAPRHRAGEGRGPRPRRRAGPDRHQPQCAPRACRPSAISLRRCGFRSLPSGEATAQGRDASSASPR